MAGDIVKEGGGLSLGTGDVLDRGEINVHHNERVSD